MRTKQLLRDPVFQLNLLLWMAKEQPRSGYRVRPFLYEQGFEIIYIEMPFAFPEETIRAAQESGLDISIRPEPDLIFGRTRNGKGLYFEAKADSFSPDSSNSKQARGHLLATGPAFGEVLKPLTAGLLCYVVPDDRRLSMSECLAALANEMTSRNLPAGSYSCHGLTVRDRKLLYCWDEAFKSYVGIVEDEIALMDDLEDDTDPSPLILVFSDEDCHNPQMRNFYRQVVIEQVRACLLCDLHPFEVGNTYRKSPDELLVQVSDGVFDYLGRKRQKGLRRLVRENVFKRILSYWESKQPGVVGLQGDQLIVRWNDTNEKEAFLNWLEDRRISFDTSKPPIEQPSLFDSLDNPGLDES